nr:MAG TPA: Protein of unknown function (DUF1289) [Caudoviricetes sp.]
MVERQIAEISPYCSPCECSGNCLGCGRNKGLRLYGEEVYVVCDFDTVDTQRER